MSANVIPFVPTEKALDAAWAEYQRLARMAVENSDLLVDRSHNEETLRAYKRFQALFLAMDDAA